MENQNEETALSTVTQSMNMNVFTNKDSFDHIQRVANVFVKSDMVPKRYINNIGNCIIALEIAQRMGASPLMVMQNLDIIQGKPAWSSVFLIATLNSSGKFSPLRYEEDEKEGGRIRAWAYDKIMNEKVYGAWVSMNMAKAEGWIDKSGSKWKTMPELMMRYRAASFFTKQFAPEVSMGLQTVEEIIDITPIQPVTTIKSNVADNTEDRMRTMILTSKSDKDLEFRYGTMSLKQQSIIDSEYNLLKGIFDSKSEDELNQFLSTITDDQKLLVKEQIATMMDNFEQSASSEKPKEELF